MRRRLLWHGFFLFLLGTLTGLVIPMFANPRMGVSAHLAGAMSGLFIVVLGLAVDEIRLGERARSVMAELAVWSNYLGWAALAAAAALGTARSTPIAGRGFGAELWKENLVDAGLGLFSAAIVAVLVMALLGLRKR